MVSVVRTPKATGRSMRRATAPMPARRLAGDEVEVRRLAAHHRAEADERS